METFSLSETIYWEADERISNLNLAEILFQYLNVAHVVLVLNGQRDGFRVWTRPFELNASWSPVEVVKEEAWSLLSQQPEWWRNKISSVHLPSTLHHFAE